MRKREESLSAAVGELGELGGESRRESLERCVVEKRMEERGDRIGFPPGPS
jgi:hypothetical protein